jgi:hypothetical protein
VILVFFHQHPGLFHGPGGSPHSWLSINNQVNGDLAARAGVPNKTILLVQEITTIRRLAWGTIGRKATSYILLPKLAGLTGNVLMARWAYLTYLSYTMDNLVIQASAGGLKGRAANIGLQRAAANVGLSRQPARLIDPLAQRTARRQIARRTALRVGAQLGLRAVPIIGYGILAYDIYTLTAHGELMGVKIYESEEYVHHYQYPVL